ncbi:MAG TPA: hypothetical protein VGH54_15650 [Mycobacterium sp.]|jgi:hypothetical protein|uniref:hypothetical protein n=1 Tax=Mycobacterium sp. TaxID=1785 RepID=UPI002F42F3B3
MVANSKTTPNPTTWDDAEGLAGLDLVEKPTLLKTPFLITGYKFTYNDSRKISYVYVEFETTPGGDRQMFNDSSANGVRLEMEEFHNAKNDGKPFELDTWYDTRLLVPGGLRVSVFPAKDERGRDVEGRAFYLTKTGGRS